MYLFLLKRSVEIVFCSKCLAGYRRGHKDNYDWLVSLVKLFVLEDKSEPKHSTFIKLSTVSYTSSVM